MTSIIYWHSRIEMLHDLARQEPRVSVELGADLGDFSSSILEILYPEKHFIVDTWASERYNEAKYQRVNKRFSSQIARGRAEIVREDSVAAASRFESQSIDFLYIDTDHRYRHTLNELLAWESKISKNGILAGDDFAVGNPKAGMEYGVIQAVLNFLAGNPDWELLGLALESERNFSFACRRKTGNQ